MAYGDKVKEVLEYIRDNPNQMQHEIAKGLEYSDSKKINGQITALKVNGRIEQVNGGYVISDIEAYKSYDVKYTLHVRCSARNIEEAKDMAIEEWGQVDADEVRVSLRVTENGI